MMFNFSNSTDMSESLSAGKAFRLTLLILFFVIGFSGNIVIIIAICSKTHLKIIVLNVLLINQATINVLDSATNIFLILWESVNNSLFSNLTACQTNAFFMCLCSFETVLALMVLCYERLLVIVGPFNFKYKFPLSHSYIVISIAWLLGFCLSSPFIGSMISIRRFPELHICYFGHQTAKIYFSISVCICILIPFFNFAVASFIFIRILFFKNLLHSQKNLEDCANIVKETDSSEILGSRAVCLLIILCTILQTPFFIAVFNSTDLSNQIENSNWLSTYEFSYTKIKIILTWMKLAYPCVLPCLALAFCKDLNQKFKNVVQCGKKNVIIDSFLLRITREGKDNFHNNRDIQAISFTVPVLFATSNGLHLRTWKENDQSIGNTAKESKVIRCDVKSSKEHIDGMDDESFTSDYNSLSKSDYSSFNDKIQSCIYITENSSMNHNNEIVAKESVGKDSQKLQDSGRGSFQESKIYHNNLNTLELITEYKEKIDTSDNDDNSKIKNYSAYTLPYIKTKSKIRLNHSPDSAETHFFSEKENISISNQLICHANNTLNNCCDKVINNVGDNARPDDLISLANKHATIVSDGVGVSFHHDKKFTNKNSKIGKNDLKNASTKKQNSINPINIKNKRTWRNRNKLSLITAPVDDLCEPKGKNFNKDSKENQEKLLQIKKSKEY